MTKTITINGENFKVMKKTVKPLQFDNFYELYSCYARPSDAKKGIYDYWNNFFTECGAGYSEHGIVSSNCMMFTYGGYVVVDDVEYYLYITKTRQEAYICKF